MGLGFRVLGFRGVIQLLDTVVPWDHTSGRLPTQEQ